MTIALPTLAGVRKAAKAIRPDVPETPMVRSEILSRALDAEVWLKNETMNPVASFKLRGALNAVLQAGSSGVDTSSTGNHGQGVAFGRVAAHQGFPGFEAELNLADGDGATRRDGFSPHIDHPRGAGFGQMRQGGRRLFFPGHGLFFPFLIRPDCELLRCAARPIVM